MHDYANHARSSMRRGSVSRAVGVGVGVSTFGG